MDPSAAAPAIAIAVAVVALVLLLLVRRFRRHRAARPQPGESLRERLTRSRERLGARLDEVLGRPTAEIESVLAEVESVLISADVGAATAGELIAAVHHRLGRSTDATAIRETLREGLADVLGSERPPTPTARPWVVLVTGVNGVGKTTTIGRLAAQHRAVGRRVLLVAADTFRAAAGDQLAVWAERTGADLVRQREGADPAAVVFDALHAAVRRGIDVVLIDTAGRLHTRTNLMNELAKLRRIAEREIEGAPHETLLVLDATTGQNAIAQARTFKEGVGVTGIVLTKLDGTARGGVVVAIRRELDLPVLHVGVGEGVGDLRPFDASEFLEALLAENP